MLRGTVPDPSPNRQQASQTRSGTCIPWHAVPESDAHQRKRELSRSARRFRSSPRGAPNGKTLVDAEIERDERRHRSDPILSFVCIPRDSGETPEALARLRSLGNACCALSR